MKVYLLRHDFDFAKEQFEKCLSLKNDRDMIIAIAATYITVMEGGEHWFHTEEQMKFLDEWI